MRYATKKRTTKETDIQVSVKLDGSGQADIHTGIGFFDHMLTLLCFHSQIDLTLFAHGDLEVCDHHCVEDCGILLGQCLKEALGDKRGIQRYGACYVPMDEALAHVVLDISDRAYLVYHCDLKRESIGSFSCEMVEEFLRAFAFQAGITLHVNVLYGTNDHHKIEAVFKALAKALKMAVMVQGNELPSSKGVL